MNYVDVYYESGDGLRLYARDYPGPAESAAPVLLCLPGLTRNSKDFADIAADLCKTHRVICPDQRGRGRSARDPNASRYQPEQYVRDMETLLNLLAIEKVVIIGTSLGGLMAMVMMARDPARIVAAVLNDIGPELDPDGIARIAGYVGKSDPVQSWKDAAQQTARINGAAFPDYDSEDWHAMARDLYVQEGHVPVLDYDASIAQGFANGSAAPLLWPVFESLVSKPMLVLRGESSDILSAQTVDEMKRRVPGLAALTVANRGHAPTLNEPSARGDCGLSGTLRLSLGSRNERCSWRALQLHRCYHSRRLCACFATLPDVRVAARCCHPRSRCGVASWPREFPAPARC